MRWAEASFADLIGLFKEICCFDAISLSFVQPSKLAQNPRQIFVCHPLASLRNTQGKREQRLRLFQIPGLEIHLAESQDCVEPLGLFGQVEDYLFNSQTFSKQRFGSCKVTAEAVKTREFAHCGCSMGVFPAKILFPEPEGAEE